MDYRNMIKDYADKGGSIEKMWASVDVTEDAMEYIKETNPDKHECLMRKLSEALYGKHYNEEMALADVKKITCLDQAGEVHQGAHWTVEQIEAATKDKVFPKGTTQWDKYVAYNLFWSDMMTRFTDEQILTAAYLFWFDDKDWKSDGKVWDYMTLNSRK